jgi:hypothetical protein
LSKRLTRVNSNGASKMPKKYVLGMAAVALGGNLSAALAADEPRPADRIDAGQFLGARPNWCLSSGLDFSSSKIKTNAAAR